MEFLKNFGGVSVFFDISGKKIWRFFFPAESQKSRPQNRKTRPPGPENLETAITLARRGVIMQTIYSNKAENHTFEVLRGPQALVDHFWIIFFARQGSKQPADRLAGCLAGRSLVGRRQIFEKFQKNMSKKTFYESLGQ